MFDPAAVASRMSPGDKVSMTVHKAKAEPGGSFVDNARAAGMLPDGGGSNATPTMPMLRPAAAPHVPQMMAVSRPAVPDHRALLLGRLRAHLLAGGGLR